jgi:uncharacterized membrane protein
MRCGVRTYHFHSKNYFIYLKHLKIMKSIYPVNRLLLLTLFFICVLIGCRVIYTNSFQHVFLVWNIFLAWIPYIISNLFKEYHHKQSWKQIILFSSWLVFFPNALYIITDLIHLQDTGGAPVWYDAILIFTSAMIGLLMAYLSLYNVERYLSQKFSSKTIVILMPVIIFTASFGVYLGRFQRWNSWDVIHSPVELATDIFQSILFPQEHLRGWGITFVLSILFYLIYSFSKVFLYQREQNKNAGQ